MNIRLAHLNQCIAQAQEDLRRCREERSALLIELCGKKPNDEFAGERGTRYRIRRIEANSKTDAVYLICHYWTSAKRWSLGTKVITHEVKKD